MRCITTLLLVVAVSATTLGCSSLTVGTEVYDHERQAMDVAATQIIRQLDGIPGRISASRPELMRAWERGKDQFPGLYTGSASAFADSYEAIARQVMEKEFGDRISALRREAYDLGGRAGGQDESSSTTTDPVDEFRRAARLQFRFENLVRDMNARFQEIATENRQQAVRDVFDWIAPQRKPSPDLDESVQDADVEKLHGMTGVTIQDVEEAKAVLRERILAGELAVSPSAVQAAGLDTLAAQLESTAEETAEAVLLPMGDPIVPRITGADDSYWKQYYNRVVGRTTFGNAEIAVKMQELGVYSMKGLVFDPSQVSQAIIDGIETTVVVAAAASGAPVTIANTSATDGKSGDSKPITTSKARMNAESRDLERRSIARAKARATLYNDLLKALDSVTGLKDGDAALKTAAEGAIEKIKTQSAVIKNAQKP